VESSLGGHLNLNSSDIQQIPVRKKNPFLPLGETPRTYYYLLNSFAVASLHLESHVRLVRKWRDEEGFAV
jgi:hypothetical protein